MRRSAPLVLALALALVTGNGLAATAYVTDELVLGVYAEQNQQGARLTTLHSGASVETLATSGDFTQVQLPDGTTGWVKTAYLTARAPATVRVKQLEEELDRSRATTPALAEAAARSELQSLRRELAAKQVQLDAATVAHVQQVAVRGDAPARSARTITVGVAAGIALGAALCGFWLGYAALARRVKRKFGGLKVY